MDTAGLHVRGSTIMEEQKREIRSSIGMFDDMKGIGMLIVIVGHTIGNYTGNIIQNDNIVFLILRLFFAVMAELVIPMFLIISGYGFRKRPIKKCIRQQTDLMLKLYIRVMVVTVIVFFLIHYGCFRYFPSSAEETFKVFGGFLFALPVPMTLFHINFFNCGVVWYIFAMFLGWIILDILMNVFSEKYWNMAVALIVILGWSISLFRNLPFCLIQGMTAVGYLYFGYKIKKRKALLNVLSRKKKTVLILCAVLGMIQIAVSGKVDNIAEARWSLGPVSILMGALLAYGVIYIALSVNKIDNIWLNAVRAIGRNSLLIFCVHTTELIAVPWYLLIPDADSIMRGIVILILRIVLIFGVCVILDYIKNKYKKKILC